MADKPLPASSELLSKLPSLNNALHQTNRQNSMLPSTESLMNRPLPSSSDLINNLPKPHVLSTPASALPSARALGINFPWHEESNQYRQLDRKAVDEKYRHSISAYKKEAKSVLPPIQSSVLPPQHNTYQQLPPQMSSSLPSMQTPKTFQNTPLQGLRTSNLGKRYMEEQPPVISIHVVSSE